MNRKAVLSLCAVLLALTARAQAATVVCSGTIDTLQFDATATGGEFSIKLSSMNIPVYFCDPDNSFAAPGSGYSISATTCRSLYATFLAAKVSGTPVANMYFDGSEVPATCDGWAAWQQANIRNDLF